jgi:proline dehydrogenase
MSVTDSLRRRRASPYGAGPTVDDAIDVCRRLASHGVTCTLGYTATPAESVQAVADAHLTALDRLARAGLDGHVSVKLTTLGFDPALFAELDAAAAQSRCGLHIDALGPETVDPTWRLIRSAPRAARIGTTLPGRWSRSADDAALAVQLGLRVRVVKGQWRDGTSDGTNPAAGFLRVVDRLRGHRAGVSVASHDAGLLSGALQRLTASGTPCSVELFLGMPFRRQAAIARRLGVPIRVYVPYGRPAAPYGVADLRENPAVAWWLIQDLALGEEKMWRSMRRSTSQL